ncbi:MAG: 4Fe-4S dicluster domain-containing protein, partial [Deltaproteobacteria bacterium]|nr:4Fe-4S dicluster domain-containing protein [Deltaproteobacteria bacterium]
SPLVIVRMAVFGLLDELIRRPEIWYCLGCQACAHDCPMLVKPSRLIGYLRWEAVRQGVYDLELINRFRAIWNRYQTVRWVLAREWQNQGSLSPELVWENDQVTQVIGGTEALRLDLQPGGNGVDLRQAGDVTCCFTCGECRGVCPIYQDHGPFDPLAIFRLVNLGQYKDLLDSAALWLCLGCRRCTESCTQGVSGHLVIQKLREKAMKDGYLDQKFIDGWAEVEKKLYTYYVTKVMDTFNFKDN